VFSGLLDLPRWLLLGALVYAPWAYGCARPWTIGVLNAWLAVVLVLWAARCAVRRSWPAVPVVLAGGSVFLVFQAWWMTFNSVPAQTGREPSTAAAVFPWAPASVDAALSFPAAVRASLLLGVVCFVCDLARHQRWRQRLWWTMGLTGASVAALGLVQKAGDAPGIFWKPFWTDGATGTFFATFAYHGNAGAFLNLVWPLVAGLTLTAFLKAEAPAQRAVSVPALALCLSAVSVNTSRAAGFLAALLLLAVLGWTARHILRDSAGQVRPLAVMGIVAAVLLVVAGMAAAVGVERVLARWSMLWDQVTGDYPRWQMTRVCLGLAGNAGWFGRGPGTFTKVLQRDLPGAENAELRTWPYAHQDYLQTVIEWGWLGAVVWFGLVLGGAALSIRAVREEGKDWSRRDRVLQFVVLAALTGVGLHALVDYPLQVASLQLYVAVLVGLLWSSRAWTRAKHSAGPEHPGEGLDASHGM
jgi:O-antigen ligase